MTVAASDADLVHAARAGDPAALGSLLERHRPALYASALSIVREREAAQDAVQETFLVALRRLGDVREPEAVAGWLQAIVRNACLMHVRRAGRVTPVEAPEPPGWTWDEATEAVERAALRDWVWAALEELPDEQRVTVMLRHFTRTSGYGEIAEATGVPIGTVRSRLSQARDRLAKALIRSAADAHSDHGTLADERRREWLSVIEEIHTTGSAAGYAAGCAPDVLVEAPSLGYRMRGVGDHRREVEEGAAAGVRLDLTNVLAGRDVTVVEADYENPPDDPDHCPATHTEVRIHPGERATRILLHYPPRPRPRAVSSEG